MSDARPLLFLGFSMLCFASVNAYIGFSLLGERGVENRKKIRDAFKDMEAVSAAQRADRSPSKRDDE